MKTRNTILLVIIIVIALVAAYIDIPGSPGIHFKLGKLEVNRDFKIRQGLDLQGGLQVLLEADLPADQKVEAGAMSQVASIIDNRVNALGVTEPLVQTQGSRRIIVELPGVENPDEAIATFKETGLLEFIDAGNTFLPLGTRVVTTFPKLESEGATGGVITSTVTVTPSATTTLTVTPAVSGTPAVTVAPAAPISPTAPPAPSGAEAPTGTITPTVSATPSATITPTATVTPTAPVTSTVVYPTVLTGTYLKSASAYRDPNTGEFGIQFELTSEGSTVFSDFTKAHADYDNLPYYYLSIVLDKQVISSPHIKSPIPEGKGVIEGKFTLEEAQQLAIQLRYGALPIPLRVETVRSVGPSLGQDSIRRSLQAGVVGLTIVLLFMLVYYRLPGLLADLALVLYGLFNIAVFSIGWPFLLLVSLLLMISYLIDREDRWALILGGVLLVGTLALGIAGFAGVTLTLPAITGFILSTGMAVDANILVFERMKEELRAGRSLSAALEAGFNRAWTSIRDSNISTLITCAILYYFGSAFAAGSVRGFAVTLALGVVINLFTAITVTRTLLRGLYNWQGERLRNSRLLADL